MSEEVKEFKVVYEFESVNAPDKPEGYNVYYRLPEENDWTWEAMFPLVRREGADKAEEKDFVSYQLINYIKNKIDKGWSLNVWCDRL